MKLPADRWMATTAGAELERRQCKRLASYQQGSTEHEVGTEGDKVCHGSRGIFTDPMLSAAPAEVQQVAGELSRPAPRPQSTGNKSRHRPRNPAA